MERTVHRYRPGEQFVLYNFLSTFSGTHYVTPRALTVEIGFHF
jgi:hypothetical protein